MHVLIEHLTHLGMGRGSDGVHYPRVLPDETIETTPDGFRIVTPSKDRVTSPCRHYKSCGGCAMQHASDAFVADWKQSVVARALAAHGIEAEYRPIYSSPPQSRRRAKFSGRRTKSGALVGFHARASGMIVNVPSCLLLSPDLTALLPALEDLTILAASRKAEISLTATQSLGGVDVLVETGQALTPQRRLEVSALAENHNLARVTWNDETVVQRHEPLQAFGKARVLPPPGAFLQATQDGESKLKSNVLETIFGAKRVVDLFSGCGTFALPAAATAEVHAVEGDAEMLIALDRGWRNTTGLKRVTTEARDLFRRPLEPDELNAFNAAIIDPPRAGAEAQIACLAQSRISKIAMISCNPVTFARDTAALLAAGYALDWVQVVDQFRWSTHVEIAASLTRT